MSLEITIELWFFILLASKQLVVVKTSLRKIFHLLTSQVVQFDFHTLIFVSSSMYIIVSSTNISLEGPSTSRFDNSSLFSIETKILHSVIAQLRTDSDGYLSFPRSVNSKSLNWESESNSRGYYLSKVKTSVHIWQEWIRRNNLQ